MINLDLSLKKNNLGLFILVSIRSLFIFSFKKKKLGVYLEKINK